MEDHTKTKLAEILNDTDRAVREAYRAGVEDTYKWFVDQLDGKIEEEVMGQLIMKFVKEGCTFPTRKELQEHYEEYLKNLGR